MNIKDKAKELCEKSGCHHKCNDTKDCVVEDEAKEVIANSATTTVKQIEEMARFMCDNYEGEGNCGDGNKCDFNCWAYREAKHLYNAGYRKHTDRFLLKENGELIPLLPKQIICEGEWIKDSLVDDTVICSLCGYTDHRFDYDRDEIGSKFCPNCGAKMKGGEE